MLIGMKWVPLVLLLMGCAPVYYGSVVYDIETTIACEQCPEGNPLVPHTKNRVILYAHGAVFATAFTLLAEQTKYPEFVYGAATILRLLVGTWNVSIN